jgi:exopolysaccharide biosynthesis polyprenyl glycosylphosphotransferase
MLKQHWRFISRLERLGDNIVIILSFFAAYYGRDSLLFWNNILDLSFTFAGPSLAPIKDYVLVLLVGLGAYSVILSAMGAYGSMRLASLGRLLYVAFASSLMVGVCLAATLFALKVDVSRAFVGLFVLISGCGLSLERYFVLKALRYWRRRGKNFRSVVICGVGRQAIRLAHNIAAHPELGIHIRAFADLRGEESGDVGDATELRDQLEGRVTVGRVLRGVGAVSQALNDHAVDEVIFTDVVTVMTEVEELILACSEQGVRTTIAADLFSMGIMKSEISHFCGTPLIHFQTPPGDSWELFVKRVLDVTLAAIALVITVPIFAALAIGVKMTPGPVLFKQTRVGLNGRLFQMLKFRSMYVGSEHNTEALKAFNEMQGPAFKMSNDPRVTPFGRLLRRFSLDELPQLYNVFVGEMSLVGPRPPIPGEVSLYERRSRRRLSMRPGLTCTWQVSGRNEISDFAQWVKLDLDYIDNWSLLGDLWLLLRTVPAVLLGRGAR